MDVRTRSLVLLAGAALLLSSTPAEAAPPDLCDELVLNASGDVYRDVTGMGISRWCEPHTDPPAWDAPVCCVVTDEANCTPANSRGRCDAGMAFWCDYGEQVGDGVACYQPAPSACEAGFCPEIENPNGMTVFYESIWVCCQDTGWWDVECTPAGVGSDPELGCGGYLTSCNWGATNADGTVDCYG